MRAIPEGLNARLQSGVTRLAHVWRVARVDGEVFGFTDHDVPITFAGLACAPATASGGAVEKSLGLGVDTASIAGALSSETLAEDGLARGLWDGARVDLYLVDWSEPTLFVHLFAGRIGETRRGAQGFEAELRGLQAALNTPTGRVYSRFCDADVGDNRCGVDLEEGAFKGAGAVATVLDARTFSTSGLGAFADGWFARGRIVWSAGGSSEISAHRVSGAGVDIELIEAPGVALEAGAEFAIYAGCDKRSATCQAKFANILNFRGFAHMPGTDAIQAGPRTGDALDGGSRHS